LNVFESEDDIVLVCPMPGVEADNIDIEILGNTVSLRASLRGVGQANRRYLLHEWSYGSYARTFHLPVEVDAERANASHSNGVLVLTLPKAERSKTVRIPLTRVNSREATHRGHSGRRDTRTTREG
jgi:HSP20 family protein